MKKALSATALALMLTLSACGGSDTTAEAPAPAEETSPAAEAPAETTEAAPETTEPEPEPEPEPPAEPVVGEPFSVDMGGGDVARITIVTAERSDAMTGQFATPPDNGGFLTLDILWETEAGTTSANPFYFTVRDAEGREGELEIFSEQQQLGSGDVAVGDKMRGFLTFDVAPGPVDVIISGPLMNEAGRIAIP